MIRVAIVEDEPGLRQALAAQLGRQPDFAVTGVFADAELAAAGLATTAADVVVTDIQLPGRSGIELVGDWKPRRPATQFLMLTMFDDDDLVFAALSAGATGYLLKRSLPAEVAVAVRELHAGGSPMSSSIARKLVQTLQRPAGTSAYELSAREEELMDWLARGRSYKECADLMALSLDTIRTYIRRLYEKLHVHSRHAAVAKVRGSKPPRT